MRPTGSFSPNTARERHAEARSSAKAGSIAKASAYNRAAAWAAALELADPHQRESLVVCPGADILPAGMPADLGGSGASASRRRMWTIQPPRPVRLRGIPIESDDGRCQRLACLFLLPLIVLGHGQDQAGGGVPSPWTPPLPSGRSRWPVALDDTRPALCEERVVSGGSRPVSIPWRTTARSVRAAAFPSPSSVPGRSRQARPTGSAM